MQYLGGKYRQGKKIAEVVEKLIEPQQAYFEPFCGALSSALAVSKKVNNLLILSDKNEALITMWQYAIDGYEFPSEVSEDLWRKYKENQNPKDPLTAFIGCGCSFAGWWFESYARRHKGSLNKNYAKTAKESIAKKIKQLKKTNYFIACKDYKDYKDIRGQFFYLDPPYKDRKQNRKMGKFDSKEFWDFARELSKNNCVIISEFEVPEDFTVLHSFGDTVARHYSHKDEICSYGNEVIVMWNKCKYIEKAFSIINKEKEKQNGTK